MSVCLFIGWLKGFMISQQRDWLGVISPTSRTFFSQKFIFKIIIILSCLQAGKLHYYYWKDGIYTNLLESNLDWSRHIWLIWQAAFQENRGSYYHEFIQQEPLLVIRYQATFWQWELIIQICLLAGQIIRQCALYFKDVFETHIHETAYHKISHSIPHNLMIGGKKVLPSLKN